MAKGASPHVLGVIAGLMLLAGVMISATARADDQGPSERVVRTHENSSNRYAINLKSSLEPVDLSAVPALEVFRAHPLYTTRFTKDGKVWNRLRIGFFPTRKAAFKVLESVREAYPDAWVAKVSEEEKNHASRMVGAAAAPAAARRERPRERVQGEARPAAAQLVSPRKESPAAPSHVPDGKDAAPTASDDRLGALMEEGKTAMTRGDYSRAVQLFTKVLDSPESRFRQEAQELLGSARERNRQLAHAKAEYEEYLRRYPEGEGTDRVRQRLAALLTAREQPKEKLRKTEKAEESGGWLTDAFGSWSQFYTRDETSAKETGTTTNQSFLTTYLDLAAKMRSRRYEIRTLLNGEYRHDFLHDEDSKARMYDMYIDMLDRDLHASARIGRQSKLGGGVLGRFDGGLFGFRVLPQAQLNVVGGFPEDRDKSLSIDTDKHFYGASVDLGTFAEHWDFNVFIISQNVSGATDRQAVGGEVRYFHPSASVFGMVDYDLVFNQLNIFLLTGNLIFPDKSTLSAALDYRKTPILTTSNALQGQTEDSISGLLEKFSEDEVRALARDRTAISRSLRLGLSRPLNAKLQIAGDVTVSDMTGTPASGGVEAVPETGTEVLYSAQLVGSNLIKEGDITIFGLSYFDSPSSDRISASVNTRYPVDRVWRIDPRFRYDYRMIHANDRTQSVFRPSLRVDYYWSKRVRFEVEAGGEWMIDRNSGETDKTLSYYLVSGYRVDF